MEVRGRDEVRNHPHVAAHAAEGAIGLLPQILGHGGHAIGVLDRELGDGEIGRILTDQRDVGAVQRRHDLQVPLALEHLLRKPGGRGVRDRIVRMHQLQLLAQRDLVLLHRQCQGVRGVLE